ncbi:Transcriptional regulator, TetR family [[Actinomadura] parvosata subsp. kistnae]|uniref:TetR family transcriptional regulator n=1 Tax=[Actinomadura] parvosata subsp. kistnae TaxID=1909395 RepID=A0A1V0A0T0_9ACTN|nr:TetR/AcrR family transcriptional regulator [Nonomuraea sp. ATCC 55076]AQZ63815.1 TetR family transcriptional regulator [Nonomuraea sp. ATCC 55076]SPL89636.1 Transcriptional regulator, TetR family [Actinomadura parvosata subsp. kistnae]
MNDDAMDLRTRNKQATREAIGHAALRLAIEQGPNGLALVRVHDIASAAGVSPRTYNNYFSSREEAICAFQADQSRRVGQALRSRPSAEPLEEAVIAAVTELYTDPEPDRAGLAMIMSTPALEGEALKAFSMAEGPLAEAIAERTGTDPRRDLFPAVTAAAVAGAIRVAGRHWLQPGVTGSFATILRSALSCVFTAAPTTHGPGKAGGDGDD